MVIKGIQAAVGVCMHAWEREHEGLTSTIKLKK